MNQEMNSEGVTHSYDEAMHRLVHGDYSTAYTQFRQLYDLHLHEFEPGILQLRLGTVCHHLGESDSEFSERAVAYLEEALPLFDPEKKELHGFYVVRICDLLGATLWRLGRVADALAPMERGLDFLREYRCRESESLRWDEADYLMLLGDIYIDLERYEESMPMYTRALEVIETLAGNEIYHAEISFRLGRAYHYLNSDEEALRILGQVQSERLTKPTLGRFYFTLLRLYVGLERYVEARDKYIQLQHSEMVAGYQAHTHHFGGIAHYCLGESGEARKAFQLSLDFPGPDWIRLRSEAYLSRIS